MPELVMAFGIVGLKTRLVPLDFDLHFENAYRWINDNDITQWLGGNLNPMSRLAEREWFEKSQKLADSDLIFAIETLEGVHIGFSDLRNISYRHGTATSGSFIGITGYWGKGLGSDAARTRCQYAFEQLGLRTLYSSYLEGNDRSGQMQKAVGYEKWGLQPQACYKNGKHQDLVHTVLTRERWEALKKMAQFTSEIG